MFEHEAWPAEWVARKDQIAAALIEQGECEHAAEPWQGVRPPLPPGLQHDLGVGLRHERHAAADQFGLHQIGGAPGQGQLVIDTTQPLAPALGGRATECSAFGKTTADNEGA